MKKKILGVSSKKFYLYCISLIIGIFCSILFIILGTKYDNSVINFFLGFSASLVITAMFAYLIDYIGQQEIRELSIMKRSIYLKPIEFKILELFHRIMAFNMNKNRIEDREYGLDDFEKCFNNVFDDYCEYVDNLTHDISDYLMNAAFSIKNRIQVECLEEIVRSIDTIMANKISVRVDRLLTDNEIRALQSLRDITEKLYLPYLEEKKSDKNTATSAIDWPKESVNNFVKNNYRQEIKLFIFQIRAISNIEDFKTIRTLKFNKNLYSNKFAAFYDIRDKK